jgi:capsular exopolysaccharide synthesis family protein
MSRFFKALEQAERDAAQRRGEVAAGITQGAKEKSGPPTTPGSPATIPPRPPDRSPEPPPAAARSQASSAPPAEAPVTPTTVERAPDVARDRPAAPVDSRPARRWNGASPEVDPHFVSLVDPTAFEAERYRSLRHFIELAHRNRGLAVVAVSSPAVGDGKTTTAINLGGALAQDRDARILLVDADLRRPAIAKMLPPEEVDVVAAPGLIDVILDSRLRLDDVVQARPYNLSVLTAGGTPDAPYELLKSPRLASLLDEARRRYDYVILDAPPLIPIPDCRIIERLVDGLLIVVGANRTPRKLLEEALEVVDPAKVLGLVFNADDQSLASYSHHYVYAANGGPSERRFPRLRGFGRAVSERAPRPVSEAERLGGER